MYRKTKLSAATCQRASGVASRSYGAIPNQRFSEYDLLNLPEDDLN
jgi:hypothetical protein